MRDGVVVRGSYWGQAAMVSALHGNMHGNNLSKSFSVMATCSVAGHGRWNEQCIQTSDLCLSFPAIVEYSSIKPLSEDC